jgi:5-methylcytosine-specific restriction protein A
MPSSLSWTHDEILVVLDAVVNAGWTGLPASSEQALALSTLLRRAQIHPLEQRSESFRSPASVHRKSEDIRTAHPAYVGTPTRGGAATRLLVRQWLANEAALRREASLVRELMLAGETPIDERGFEASEGRLVDSWVLRRERSATLRTRKLDAVSRAGFSRACEVCRFDFDLVYGAAHAGGYVEVHHLLPLHVSGETQTSLSDLVLVCANCHRMLHRYGTISPQQLRERLGEQEMRSETLAIEGSTGTARA